MKQKFGIFKAVGQQVHFNKIGGTGLVQLSTPLFNSPEDAIEYLEYSLLIDHQTSNFLIMPVYEYFKESAEYCLEDELIQKENNRLV